MRQVFWTILQLKLSSTTLSLVQNLWNHLNEFRLNSYVWIYYYDISPLITLSHTSPCLYLQMPPEHISLPDLFPQIRARSLHKWSAHPQPAAPYLLTCFNLIILSRLLYSLVTAKTIITSREGERDGLKGTASKWNDPPFLLHILIVHLMPSSGVISITLGIESFPP